MKKRFLASLSALSLFFLSLPQLSAQDLEMGYFLGGNPYAFRLNPAFQSERGIFSVALGGTSIGVWSNLGVSTMLYPDSATGEMYTFMNDKVSASEFLKKINRKNNLNVDVNLNLLTVGFWSNESFITLDFNARSLNGASIPYDYFNFVKQGTDAGSTFDLSGLGVRSKSFLEAAFGWSRNFNDVFNVGVRVKGLVGIAEVENMMSKADLTMDENRWEITAEGYLNASSPSVSVTHNEEGYIQSIDINEDVYGPAGFGGAVDLGFSWNVWDDLTLSGAVLDLGGIRWNREVKGITPNATYTWAPSQDDPATDQEAIDREVEEMVDALSGLFQFQDVSRTGAAEFEMLPYRIHLGAEYRMPFYDKLSVGALYMMRGGSCFAKNTARLSLNWNPLSFLSLSTGTSLNRLGESIGFALNLHPAGINLLLGCDYIPMSVVKIESLVPENSDALSDIPVQYRRFLVVPTNQMKMNLYVGLNLALGKRHLDHARRIRR